MKKGRLKIFQTAFGLKRACRFAVFTRRRAP